MDERTRAAITGLKEQIGPHMSANRKIWADTSDAINNAISELERLSEPSESEEHLFQQTLSMPLSTFPVTSELANKIK